MPSIRVQNAAYWRAKKKLVTPLSSQRFEPPPELVQLFRDADYAFQFCEEIRLRKNPPDKGGRKWKNGKGWIKIKRRSQLVGYADDADTCQLKS